MIKIHREGRLIIAATTLVLVAIGIAVALALPGEASYITSALALLVLILMLRFFRVPRRRPFLDQKSIVAPADGRVVAIEKVHQQEFLDAPCMQVSIFMSIHDVHINYYPVSGDVGYLKYHPGRYLVARHPKSSSLNERYSIGIENPNGSLLVCQIAGYVARRIKCYTHPGQPVKQGEEMGFIKFGSRLDLFIPLNAELKIEVGDKTLGSVTTIARFK
jgi:phosphatidylserine decarboxylase